jgi:hypothetical protein
MATEPSSGVTGRLSTWSLILSLISLPLAVFWYQAFGDFALLAIPLAIGAIVVGAIGRKRHSTRGSFATTGIVLGVLALVVAGIYLALYYLGYQVPGGG